MVEAQGRPEQPLDRSYHKQEKDMTLRERILAVYAGDTPDVVPYMLDLSHWFYEKNRLPWDLSTTYEKPEYSLIDYHKKAGVGFYVPNNNSIVAAAYGKDVKSATYKTEDGREIVWELETPLGSIRRKRRWEDATYAWGISEWGIRTEQDLKALGWALGSLTYEPRWHFYEEWKDYIGDHGVVYLSGGYSAMGQLLNYWMGIEATVFAAIDWNRTMHDVVDQINAGCLRRIDLLCQSPAEIAILGDNFSSDIQPPHFFKEWSKPYYAEAIRRLHDAGKYVAVHIDGKLEGALNMFREIGIDCADAVTPVPMGDLDPEQCREEAGPEVILSGGVSPELWYSYASRQTFEEAVLRWLDLKKHGPRFIANAGDQVPPGAEEDRIFLMRDLVEKHGRY